MKYFYFIVLVAYTLLSSSICTNNLLSNFTSQINTLDCTEDKHCSEDYHCNLDSNTCTHKEYLPFSPKQFFSLLLLGIIAGIATSSGIGGGTVISTILMSIDNFTP